MLPLGGETSVSGDYCPAVIEFGNMPASGVKHRLNGEDHSRFHDHAVVLRVVVADKRIFMEITTDAVTAVFVDDRKPLGVRNLFAGDADVI